VAIDWQAAADGISEGSAHDQPLSVLDVQTQYNFYRGVDLILKMNDYGDNLRCRLSITQFNIDRSEEWEQQRDTWLCDGKN
jgi:hypothetical protein